VFEKLEPSGVGALQMAFDQLKAASYGNEGLFDPERKRPIFRFCRARHRCHHLDRTGAVVHDMSSASLAAGFRTCPSRILPVRVQGPGADEEICRAISLVNRDAQADVVILARGGGSLEDLQPFNSERVARAVAGSELPVISAVGHETDTTISDLAADMRASTPSVAAELAVPERARLEKSCLDCRTRLQAGMTIRFRQCRIALEQLTARLRSPARKLADQRLRVDDLSCRLHNATKRTTRQKKEHMTKLGSRLQVRLLGRRIAHSRQRLEHARALLLFAANNSANQYRSQIGLLAARLETLNPLAVLARGYSISRHAGKAAIIKNIHDVSVNNTLEILLKNGTLMCRVERIIPHDFQDEF
jgi:exodeoxyribonuclease VII large subunit